MKHGKSGVNIASKVPIVIRNWILETVDEGHYISVSDFVRQAVKEKLDSLGYSYRIKSVLHDGQQ